MYYEKFEDYLNTEHRKAIKHYIEKGNKEKAMECVDYLLDKYRESLAMAKMVEDKLGSDYPKISGLEIAMYLGEKCRPIDWDTMESVFDSDAEENAYYGFNEEDEEE